MALYNVKSADGTAIATVRASSENNALYALYNESLGLAYATDGHVLERNDESVLRFVVFGEGEDPANQFKNYIVEQIDG